MAGAPNNVKPDPKEIKRAEEYWDKFVAYSKWGIYATCGLVALLGLIFIDWA